MRKIKIRRWTCWIRTKFSVATNSKLKSENLSKNIFYNNCFSKKKIWWNKSRTVNLTAANHRETPFFRNFELSHWNSAARSNKTWYVRYEFLLTRKKKKMSVTLQREILFTVTLQIRNSYVRFRRFRVKNGTFGDFGGEKKNQVTASLRNTALQTDKLSTRSLTKSQVPPEEHLGSTSFFSFSFSCVFLSSKLNPILRSREFVLVPATT